MIKYNRKLFKTLWNKGLLMRELAEHFNCTEKTVYNIAKKEKLTLCLEVLKDENY